MWRRILFQPLAARVSDNSDDGQPVIIGSPLILTLKAFSQRVFLRPVPARHRLVDYRYERRISVVMLGEISTSQQRDAHRREVFSAYRGPCQSAAVAWVHRSVLKSSQAVLRRPAQLEQTLYAAR